MRAEPLAIAHDSGLRLRAQVVNKEHTIIYRAQLLKEVIEPGKQGCSCLLMKDNGLYHIMVALLHGFKLIFPCLIAIEGLLRSGNQLVGDTSQCTHHDNDLFLFSLYDTLQAEDAFYGTYGRSAKFHYFHFVIFCCLCNPLTNGAIIYRVQKYKINREQRKNICRFATFLVILPPIDE